MTVRKFLETSADFLEISADLLEISADFLEITADILETSADLLEISADFLETSADLLETSTARKFNRILRRNLQLKSVLRTIVVHRNGSNRISPLHSKQQQQPALPQHAGGDGDRVITQRDADKA
jgi:3-dehydroquinate dehydratase